MSQTREILENGVYAVYTDGHYELFWEGLFKGNIAFIGIAHDGHYFGVPLDWNYGRSPLLEREYPKDDFCMNECDALLDWDFVKHTRHIQELGTPIKLKEGHFLPVAPVFLAMYGNKENLNAALAFAGAEEIDFSLDYWFAERCNVYLAWLFYGTTRYLYINHVHSTFQVGAVVLWEPKI